MITALQNYNQSNVKPHSQRQNAGNALINKNNNSRNIVDEFTNSTQLTQPSFTGKEKLIPKIKELPTKIADKIEVELPKWIKAFKESPDGPIITLIGSCALLDAVLNLLGINF